MPLFDNILANNLLMMVSLWCIATIVQHYSHVILIFSGMKQVKLSVINPCYVHNLQVLTCSEIEMWCLIRLKFHLFRTIFESVLTQAWPPSVFPLLPPNPQQQL